VSFRPSPNHPSADQIEIIDRTDDELERSLGHRRLILHRPSQVVNQLRLRPSTNHPSTLPSIIESSPSSDDGASVSCLSSVRSIFRR